MNYKSFWPLFRRTVVAWDAHDAPRWGAALAFYTIVSMAPLVILAMAIVALVFDRAAAQTQLLAEVRNMMGDQGAETVNGMLASAQKPVSGAVASILGVITLVFGASGAFAELQSALNKIWEVGPQRTGSIWRTIQQRFFSFGMVFAVGFLLLASLLLSAALGALGKFFGSLLPVPDSVLGAINFLVALAGITLSFALIFRYVPRAKIRGRVLWTGAAFTALLFTIGKILLGLYVSKAAVGSAYGAAGSLVVVIVWVYYSAMIFLFGAEFTHELSLGREARTTSRPHALENAA